jgi:hypothetical protein
MTLSLIMIGIARSGLVKNDEAAIEKIKAEFPDAKVETLSLNLSFLENITTFANLGKNTTIAYFHYQRRY